MWPKWRKSEPSCKETGGAQDEQETKAKIGYIVGAYSNLRGLVSVELFARDGRHFHVGDTLSDKSIRSEVRDVILWETMTSRDLVRWTGIENNVNANSAHTKVITAARLLRNFGVPGVNDQTHWVDPGQFRRGQLLRSF